MKKGSRINREPLILFPNKLNVVNKICFYITYFEFTNNIFGVIKEWQKKESNDRKEPIQNPKMMSHRFLKVFILP